MEATGNIRKSLYQPFYSIFTTQPVTEMYVTTVHCCTMFQVSSCLLVCSHFGTRTGKPVSSVNTRAWYCFAYVSGHFSYIIFSRGGWEAPTQLQWKWFIWWVAQLFPCFLCHDVIALYLQVRTTHFWSHCHHTVTSVVSQPPPTILGQKRLPQLLLKPFGTLYVSP